MKKPNHLPGFLLIAGWLILILAACTTMMVSNMTAAPASQPALPKATALALGTPGMSCPVAPASWQGLIPGKSTRDDVIATLGKPIQSSPEADNRETLVYSPTLTDGDTTVANYIGLKNGIVEWMEVWVMDVDGQFHTVAEFAQHYGETLDTVYVNGVFDMFGPDQIYLWSHCGFALIGYSASYIKRSKDEILPLAQSIDTTTVQLNLLSPVPPEASVQPYPDPTAIVSRQMIFAPTSPYIFNTTYAELILYLPVSRLYQQRFTR